MIYRGFEIMLERQQCEFFNLDDSGDVRGYAYDCPDSQHDGFFEFVAFDEKTGERFIGAEDLDSLKAYIDKAMADAEAKAIAA